MPLISVIIPVYNVEKYLNECVDSVINQTYKNLEIILVDDGSTDSGVTVCDEYASKDKRVKVIHKENGGLSSARNAGLDIFAGDYVFFLDSDDYLTKDALEFLYSKMTETGADVAACSFYYTYKNCCIKQSESLKECLISPAEAYYEMLAAKYIFPSAWGKLYKRKIFTNLRYCEGILYEDTHFAPQLVKEIDSFFATTEPKVYYRQRHSSIMLAGFNKKNMDWLFVYKHCLDEARENFPNAVSICKKRYYDSFIWVLQKIIDANYEHSEEYNYVIGLIKKHFWSMFFSSKASFKRRISLIILMLSPKKYVNMYKKTAENEADDKEYFD